MNCNDKSEFVEVMIMRKYSREEWGISRTEYNRLFKAVEQGIIPDFTVEGRRYELQHGDITVVYYDRIRPWIRQNKATVPV